MKKLYYIAGILPLMLALTPSVQSTARTESEKKKVSPEVRLRSEENIMGDIAEEQARYFIQITSERNRARLAEPMIFEVRIVCREQSITFTNFPNPFENFRFTVYDERNNRVMPSHQYTLWMHKEGTVGISGGDRVTTLRPGETYSIRINLANWFALERTGRYRVEGVFNPYPADPDMFRIPAAMAYFFVDEAADGTPNIAVAAEKKDDIPVLSPSAKPPYEVVEDLFGAMQRRSWGDYFRNMHLPSLLMITSRYRDFYEWKFGPAEDSFTDIEAGKQYISANLSNALLKKFGDNSSLLQMKKAYGDSYVNDLVNAYKKSPVSVMALAYEVEFMKKLPRDKEAFFAEYRKYLVSRFDRDIRFHFLQELERRAYDAGYDPPKAGGHGAGGHEAAKTGGHGDAHGAMTEGQRLWTMKEAIAKESKSNEFYELMRYEMLQTTITNIGGLPTAYVQTKVYEKISDSAIRHEYKPISLRFFTLKKLGEYWWIVDYFDTILVR